MRLEEEGQQAAALRNKLKVELAWVRRQPKARSTKSKARLQAYEELSARERETRPASTGPLQIESKMARLGSSLLELEDASLVVAGRTLLSNFSYEFVRGERVGIVGPNGAGKTTLLRALAGLMPLASGRTEVGETVVVGYYEQQGIPLEGEGGRADQRVLELVREAKADGCSSSSSLSSSSVSPP